MLKLNKKEQLRTMNKYQYIIDKANEIIEECGTRDPFKIAKYLNISVKFLPMEAKGFYYADPNIKLVTLQENMLSALTRSVMAHEVGHDVLHGEEGQEVVFIDDGINLNNIRTDIEANLFASALLIPADELKELIFTNQYDIYQIAGCFDVDPNLVAFNINKLVDYKDKLREIEYNSDFLE